MTPSTGDRCKVPPAFWRAVVALGVQPASLLRQARLPVTLHLEERARISTAQFFSLWRGLEALVRDPSIGIRLVEGTATASHPPASLAAFYARDYRDGLHRIARFKRLCTPEKIDIAEGADLCTVKHVWIYGAGSEPAISTDVAFATLVELGRRGTGVHITPERVHLMRPDPGTSQHRDYFGCDVEYHSPCNVLQLRSSDLDRPFPGHNPELLDMLTPTLTAALGECETDSHLCDRVKVVLKRILASGRPDLSEVARDLGIGERTLQRRITEAGTTFRELLAQARQELGRKLLSDPSTEIDEVACLLGYQDTTSFYRAFRDWEGVTPSRWRKMNRTVSERASAAPFSIH